MLDKCPVCGKSIKLNKVSMIDDITMECICGEEIVIIQTLEDNIYNDMNMDAYYDEFTNEIIYYEGE